ncbi:PhnE/PtxC family ABC transporter permease [Desulfogranum mediterraneum]|uniref:PhnE/PtxC family ABC transporter permease n=1 Tax=Desulfogranum mediterraneum TaxID=160661 RepID=UPI000421F78D|nr:hypothetical protein [Desulfogranum mediterraneum]
MVRTSLSFLALAGIALLFSDLSISTLDPWQELGRMLQGMLSPRITDPWELARGLARTLSIALLGISLAVAGGGLFALYFDHRPVRLFCAFIRAVHELFWALLLMPLMGLNALCAVLAIAIPYAGVFAKVYAEIIQESERQATDSLPPGVSRLSGFFFTTLPLIYRDLKNYTSYRFECGLRSSAILGFIGLPTLGYHLETAFSEAHYSEAAALLYCFFLLIISLKYWARPGFIVVPLVAALLLTSWESSLSLANITRFLSYDILPWPMREAGFYDGSRSVAFSLWPTLLWCKQVLVEQALPGLWLTLLLSQIVLVGSGLFALSGFPPATTPLSSPAGRGLAHLLLVALRTTPEYILAYCFLVLWGPSMLPAIAALVLHNGAILAYLSARDADGIPLPFDASEGRLNRYCYELLPRLYGRFLAFLFYRWEVIMRESAILGILGLHTLGFYIDSAMSVDHLDTAMLLILVTALANMGVDSCSQEIRRRLRISAEFTSST